MNTAYDDIIYLEHHTSVRHRPMDRLDRAAQFSPFAALTGYEGAIREKGRLTQDRVEISEELRDELDHKQGILLDRILQQPEIAVTYFLPDIHKAGGQYVTVCGELKAIDQVHRCMRFVDGRSISIEDIIGIDSSLFDGELGLFDHYEVHSF